MDSAKKSVEKVLEIAKKHGYACVVGFWKEGTDRNHPYTMDKVHSGATGPQKDVDAIIQDSISPMLDRYKDGVKDGEE